MLTIDKRKAKSEKFAPVSKFSVAGDYVFCQFIVPIEKVKLFKVFNKNIE